MRTDRRRGDACINCKFYLHQQGLCAKLSRIAQKQYDKTEPDLWCQYHERDETMADYIPEQKPVIPEDVLLNAEYLEKVMREAEAQLNKERVPDKLEELGYTRVPHEEDPGEHECEQEAPTTTKEEPLSATEARIAELDLAITTLRGLVEATQQALLAAALENNDAVMFERRGYAKAALNIYNGFNKRRTDLWKETKQ